MFDKIYSFSANFFVKRHFFVKQESRDDKTKERKKKTNAF